MARRVGPSPALLRALIPCRENPTDPAARLVLADILESLDKGELARWVRRSLEECKRLPLPAPLKRSIKPIEFVDNGWPGFTASSQEDLLEADGDCFASLIEIDPTAPRVKDSPFEGILDALWYWRPRTVPIVGRFTNMPIYPHMNRVLGYSWMERIRILHLENCVLTHSAWEQLLAWKPLAKLSALILSHSMVTPMVLDHLVMVAAKSDWQLLDLRNNDLPKDAVALPGFSRIPNILLE